MKKVNPYLIAFVIFLLIATIAPGLVHDAFEQMFDNICYALTPVFKLLVSLVEAGFTLVVMIGIMYLALKFLFKSFGNFGSNKKNPKL